MPRSIYKSAAELVAMLPAGALTCDALDAVEAAVAPGVTTLELDAIARRTIEAAGGEPNFALVPGYAHTICASVDDAVVHGIPNDEPLEAGALLSVDCGAQLDGWNGDSARTFVVPGEADAQRVADGERVSDACRAAMWAGVASLATRKHLSHVGADIEAAVLERGEFGILTDYTGHGIGRSMHEDPTLYNYAVRGRGPVVKAGLAVCVEPMITLGDEEVAEDADGWTVRTVDGSIGAHWEHTVLVHANGVWVSTAHDGGAAGLESFGITPVRPVA